jgi:hypothetical protein
MMTAVPRGGGREDWREGGRTGRRERESKGTGKSDFSAVPFLLLPLFLPPYLPLFLRE